MKSAFKFIILISILLTSCASKSIVLPTSTLVPTTIPSPTPTPEPLEKTILNHNSIIQMSDIPEGITDTSWGECNLNTDEADYFQNKGVISQDGVVFSANCLQNRINYIEERIYVLKTPREAERFSEEIQQLQKLWMETSCCDYVETFDQAKNVRIIRGNYPLELSRIIIVFENAVILFDINNTKRMASIDLEDLVNLSIGKVAKRQ